MTEEEIKSLKDGDKYTVTFKIDEVEGEYLRVFYEDGTYYGLVYKENWTMLEKATLVKPTPTFEKGDTVRIVPDPMTGTIYGKGSLYGNWVLGEARILEEFKQATEMKLAKNDGQIVTINVHCLELVKKEEKEKYRVVKYGDEFQIIWADFHVAARFDKIIHPNAKAAAQAECDRLNAEWHKQQLN